MQFSSTTVQIRAVQPIVGLEIHVELATRTKMFSRAPNVAHPEHQSADPNTLTDPVVLALPGALPVPNKAAVELSILVGLALGCSIAPTTRWDRKSYFYPDLPKGYQISQYQLPLCHDGVVELPPIDAAGEPDWTADTPGSKIGIIRAHLEEDAGKLLHEAPGGKPIDGSIIDLNRAGTPLLEIVTQPDFTSADQAVLFARTLRSICRFLGATLGVMQKGHIRFEPNINCRLTLEDGRTVNTPIVEVKNLNSFRALKGAIDYELREQPERWQQDGREMGPGAKSTRGWDDARERTTPQREKEDAHDYRYFPDPDLLALDIDAPRVERIGASLPELPPARLRRYTTVYNLGVKEASALVEERADNDFYERSVRAAIGAGVPNERAGKQCANFVLQSGLKRANERAKRTGEPVLVSDLGITPEQIAGIVALRESGELGSSQADELFGLLCDAGPDTDARPLAHEHGLLTIRDDAALEGWCDAVIARNPGVADDVRSGKLAAVGRLVGEVKKLSGGAADAKLARELLLKKLGQG